MLDGDQERGEERELSEMGEQGRRGPESVLPCDLTYLIIHSSTCKAVFFTISSFYDEQMVSDTLAGLCMAVSGAVVKNSPAHAGEAKDVGSIPGSGRSPEEGNGNPLQYSYLENPMCWSFNGPEPGGPESERKRLIPPGLRGKPTESCS